MRKDFYNTSLWRKQSHLFALSKQCICEKCHRPVYVDGVTNYLPKEKRLKYVVHHIEHLTDENYMNENISLNWDNLMLLCIDCHNQIHSEQVVRDGLMFDEFGNLVEHRIGTKRNL